MTRLRASTALLRLLIRLYPRRFRETNGEEMVRLFRARCEDCGRRGLPALWLRTLPDLLRCAVAERLDSSFGVADGRPPRYRQPRGLLARFRLEMQETLHDLRFAARTLRKSPGFTLTAVLTLGLGIAANTAIFSIVNGVLLRPLPHIHDASRLVEISRDLDGSYFDISYGAFELMRQQADVLEDMASGTFVTIALGGAQQAEPVAGYNVTGNYFDVVGVAPQRGRFFAAERSFYPRVESAAVISHHLWTRRFGADPSVIGREVLLNGVAVPIVGITPEGFGGHAVGLQIDVWLPIGLPIPGLRAGQELDNWYSGVVEGIGRLAPRATAATAAAALTAAVDARNQELGQEPGTWKVRVVPHAPVPAMARSGVEVFFALLMAMMAMTLGIVCANLAGMQLSRAGEHSREVAVRLALGAARRRVMRQLLTESVLLGLVAGAVGVAASYWAVRTLMTLQPPIPMPGVRLDFQVAPDMRVLTFSLLVAVAAGLLFGLAPALQVTRPDLLPALKDDATGFGVRRGRLRSSLTGAQMAVTVVLLIGSGLFIRALGASQSVDPGFDPSRVWVFGFDVEMSGRSQSEGQAFFSELRRRVGAVPGVEKVALNHKLPMSGRSSFGDLVVEGLEPPPGRTGLQGFHNIVSPGFFEAVRMPVRGRDFDAADDAAEARVAVISEAFARRAWPDDEAIGQSFDYGGFTYRVIGIAGDLRHRDLSERYDNMVYLSAGQVPNNALTLYARVEPGSPSPLIAVRAIAHELDAGLPLLSAEPLAATYELLFLPQRVAAWVTGVVGAFGLVLGAMGVYGAAAYAAGRRTREIGVRKALGADGAGIALLVLREGIRAPAAGLGIGLIAALGLSQLLQSFLFGVSPFDPLTYVATATLLLGVAAVATLLPARRAAELDPAITLRAD